MPRKKRPQPCGCRCGGLTAGGQYLPGHDQRLYGAICDEVGGLAGLLDIVEAHLGHQITAHLKDIKAA